MRIVFFVLSISLFLCAVLTVSASILDEEFSDPDFSTPVGGDRAPTVNLTFAVITAFMM